MSCSLVRISVRSIASISITSLSIPTSYALITIRSPASTTTSAAIQGSWYLTLRLRIEGDLWGLGMGPTYLGFRGHWELIEVVLEELTGSGNVRVVVLWAWAIQYELYATRYYVRGVRRGSSILKGLARRQGATSSVF